MTTNISQESIIDARVKNIMIEKLGCKESELTNNPSFTSDLNVDSLDLCEVFMELEKEFSIQIPDEEAEKLTTVDSVIHYIKKKQTSN
jgi:acyl carrier protein